MIWNGLNSISNSHKKKIKTNSNKKTTKINNKMIKMINLHLALIIS